MTFFELCYWKLPIKKSWQHQWSLPSLLKSQHGPLSSSRNFSNASACFQYGAQYEFILILKVTKSKYSRFRMVICIPQMASKIKQQWRVLHTMLSIICIRLSCNAFTHEWASNPPFSAISLRRKSMAMNTPVLPTPALERAKSNHDINFGAWYNVKSFLCP